MSTEPLTTRDEVVKEMRASGKYAEPVAGKPVLGYLGDLGHVYARPDQLTKEALFSKTAMPEPLVQSPEQKVRAASYEHQMSMDAKIQSTQSVIAGLADRFVNMFSQSKTQDMKNKPRL